MFKADCNSRRSYEEEAYGMLDDWRLSMPRRPSESCPTCAEGSQEVDDLKLEGQQLKAEVVELKAEVERLKAEVVELKYVRTLLEARAQKPPPAHDTAVSADDTKDAVHIAVPEDEEDISHDG